MDVVVIDVDERSFEGLSPEYSGFRIVGDATEAAVLRQAGVGTSSAVVAATPDDSVNLMIAQVAKLVLGADRVVARVSDPARRAVYHGLEIETVCPATLAVDAVAAYLTMMPADAVEEAP
jgi:trk system potassium uptake protein TrkA